MNNTITKISKKEIREFNRLLGLLTISNIPIIDSIELILKQLTNENFKTVVKDILSSLKSGKSLSASFKRHNNLFSDIYIANLIVAEETGNLSDVLFEYNKFEEKFEELTNKITQAARYPLFVIVVSAAVILFMLLFLIPTLKSLFLNSKSQIPAITDFLLSISNYLQDNYLFIIIAVIAGLFFCNRMIKTPYFKENISDKLLIKLPVISSIYLKNVLARFSLSMSILLRNNVTLVEALKYSKNITDNSIFRTDINLIIKDLLKGNKLTQRIQKSVFFDYTFTKLLSAGEESAELENVFSLISDFYTKEFDNDLNKITSLIEPVLILFVGVIVAVILIAMYLPMFELIDHLGV
ncbi:MAG: type II secretion system F family protein [Rhodothermaceae bacterium]